MLTVMLITIFGLVFTSAALLTWQIYPVGAKVVGDFQTKRAIRDVRKLDRMFLDVSTQKLVMIYTITPFILGAAGYVFGQSIAFAGGGVAFGIIIPNIVIRILERRRIDKFCQQLLDALMVLSSSLKGGLSLLQSFEVLVEEMPDPMSQEFALVLRENQMGVPLHESLEQLNKRIKSDALNLIITAIDIARETGGNLTEPFHKLMFSLRERDKLIGKVKTLTMQAKLQGILMSVMPIFFGIVVYNMNPEFLKIMLDNPTGKMLLMLAAFLEVIGAFLLIKLSKVDV